MQNTCRDPLFPWQHVTATPGMMEPEAAAPSCVKRAEGTRGFGEGRNSTWDFGCKALIGGYCLLVEGNLSLLLGMTIISFCSIHDRHMLISWNGQRLMLQC